MNVDRINALGWKPASAFEGIERVYAEVKSTFE